MIEVSEEQKEKVLDEWMRRLSMPESKRQRLKDMLVNIPHKVLCRPLIIMDIAEGSQPRFIKRKYGVTGGAIEYVRFHIPKKKNK